MTYDPMDGAQPPMPPPALPQEWVQTPPPAPRRRPVLAITLAALGAVVALSGAALAGHAVWSAISHSSNAPYGDSYKPGHDGAMPNYPIDDLDVRAASDEEKVGVVTILTDIAYNEHSQAAGTGSVLTADGQVLTNNHVIDGSSTIEVTIESTGKTYDAVVLGTDKTNDVALLQIVDVSGLDTVDLGRSAVELGDRVASIGNAQGTGDLVTARGTVTSIDDSLSIGNGYGGEYEKLDDLIEIDADVVSGDSGGPLVDDDGDVVGMVTAASTSDSDIRGYAIKIVDAMAIVEQIRSGEETDTVNIGPTAFLGVTLAEKQGTVGVTIDGTLAGTPADKAGLVDGDIITSVGGTLVNTVEEIRSVVRAHEPGDVVTVIYTDAGGVERSVDVTLTEGPA